MISSRLDHFRVIDNELSAPNLRKWNKESVLLTCLLMPSDKCNSLTAKAI